MIVFFVLFIVALAIAWAAFFLTLVFAPTFRISLPIFVGLGAFLIIVALVFWMFPTVLVWVP